MKTPNEKVSNTKDQSNPKEDALVSYIRTSGTVVTAPIIENIPKDLEPSILKMLLGLGSVTKEETEEQKELHKKLVSHRENQRQQINAQVEKIVSSGNRCNIEVSEGLLITSPKLTFANSEDEEKNYDSADQESSFKFQRF